MSIWSLFNVRSRWLLKKHLVFKKSIIAKPTGLSASCRKIWFTCTYEVCVTSYSTSNSCSGVEEERIETAGINKTAPLKGVRILDLTRVLAGPYATMILGDLGAEVIKIEKPGSGDFTRSWGPPFCGDQSAYFLSVNRNKKSVVVDFQKPEGINIIKQLAKKSDVLIENFLPGKLEELGIGYEDLKQEGPRLIFCSITGYGQSGPYKDRGGFDVTAAAIGGLLHITGPEDGEPCRVGVAITDIATGLYAHGAIMAALIDRQKTGQGTKIDCSLISTQIAVLSHIAVNYLNTGMDLGRAGTGHHSIVPYQAFKTKDGYLVVGAGNDEQFQSLCKIIKEPLLCSRSEFATNFLRVANRKKLIPILSERFSKHSTTYWLNQFKGSSLPYGPINNLQQAMTDPQVSHLGLIKEVDHPSAGKIKMPGPAVFFSHNSILRDTLPPPMLGQHTKEVLKDILDLTQSEISDLVRSGTVRLGQTVS